MRNGTGSGYQTITTKHDDNVFMKDSGTVETSETNSSKCKDKWFSLTLNKKLLPVKIFCFFMYGDSFVITFCTVLFKQRGISAAEIATIFIFASGMQILSIVLLGMILENFKKPKLLLSFDLLILIIVLLTLTFLPPVTPVTCIPDFQSFICSTHNATARQLPCGATNDTVNVGSCFELFEDQHSHQVYNEMSYNISLDSPLDIVDYVYDHHDAYYYITNNSVSWKGENLNDLCDLFNNAESCIVKRSARTYLVVLYGVIIVLFLATHTISLRLADAIVVVMSKNNGGEYGKQHFFGILGHLSLSAVAGYVVDLLTPEEESPNYALAIYMGVSLMVPLFPLIAILDVTLKESEERKRGSLFQLLKTPDVIMFVFTVVILGTFLNFSYVYSAWFLVDFKAPALLLGVYEALCCGYGLPFLFTATYFLKKVGKFNFFILAHFAFAVYFVLMSYMENPWFSLIYESTYALSFFLPWVSIMEYCHEIAPEGSESTVIVIAGSLYFNVGKVVMALSGGYMLSEYGERVGFRFMACLCLATGLITAIYYGLRKMRSQGRYDTRVKRCFPCLPCFRQ